MAEWCVSESGSEDEGRSEDTSATVDVGGMKISHNTLLELMKKVEDGRSLELNCLNEVHRKKHKKKAKKCRQSKVHSPAGLKSGEEVSETASEVRSTTSTTCTATDYREGRRANVLSFDPHYDPELDEQPPVAMETKSARGMRAPPKPQQTKLASLDKIIQANARRKQQILDAPATPTAPSPPYDPMNHVSSGVNGKGAGLENGEQTGSREIPSFGFDEDEDDMEEQSNSESDMKFSLLSQLNRVEKLLDADGLT